MPTNPTPTLIVGDWASACSVCGLGTDLAPAHQVVLPGYGCGIPPPGPPCGATYKAVALSPAGNRASEKNVRAIAARLGLPYAGVAYGPVKP